MPIRGVVDDELRQHAQAQAMRLTHELPEIGASAVIRMDVVVIGDVSYNFV